MLLSKLRLYNNVLNKVPLLYALYTPNRRRGVGLGVFPPTCTTRGVLATDFSACNRSAFSFAALSRSVAIWSSISARFENSVSATRRSRSEKFCSRTLKTGNRSVSFPLRLNDQTSRLTDAAKVRQPVWVNRSDTLHILLRSQNQL
jgi:hypothetical protein